MPVALHVPWRREASQSRSPDKAEGRIRGGAAASSSIAPYGLAALRFPGLRSTDSGWGVAGYRDAMPAALHVPRLRPPRGRSLLLYFRATGIASRPSTVAGSLPEKPEAPQSRSPDKAEGRIRGGDGGAWFHCTVAVWPRFAFPGYGARTRAGTWLGAGTRCLLPSMSPGSGLREAGASSFTSGQQASHPGLDRAGAFRKSQKHRSRVARIRPKAASGAGAAASGSTGP